MGKALAFPQKIGKVNNDETSLKPHNEKNLADCELSAKGAHGGVEPAEQPVDPLNASNQATPYYPSVLVPSKKVAFTLAEVLITLGIIGVVAAMTLPTLIQKKTNSEVEAKLKKIYSVMNQAILMSENDNGPKEYWPLGCGYGSYPDCSEYYNKYIIPYLNKASVKGFESFGGTNIAIYFFDGTALVGKEGYQYFFFPNAKNLDTETFAQVDENGQILSRKDSGITYFSFALYSSNTHENYKYHYKKGFEPCKFELPEFTKQDITGAHSYACRADGQLKIWCTALIQLNGWKIPDDYPFKVK